jgi:hypothetical protein
MSVKLQLVLTYRTISYDGMAAAVSIAYTRIALLAVYDARLHRGISSISHVNRRKNGSFLSFFLFLFLSSLALVITYLLYIGICLPTMIPNISREGCDFSRQSSTLRRASRDAALSIYLPKSGGKNNLRNKPEKPKRGNYYVVAKPRVIPILQPLAEPYSRAGPHTMHIQCTRCLLDSAAQSGCFAPPRIPALACVWYK